MASIVYIFNIYILYCSSPRSYLWLLAFHGFCAFLLNLSNFEANKQTSPLLICVGGNVKQVFYLIWLYSSIGYYGHCFCSIFW